MWIKVEDRYINLNNVSHVEIKKDGDTTVMTLHYGNRNETIIRHQHNTPLPDFKNSKAKEFIENVIDHLAPTFRI